MVYAVMRLSATDGIYNLEGVFDSYDLASACIQKIRAETGRYDSARLESREINLV